MADGFEGFEKTTRFPTTSWTLVVNARRRGASEGSRAALGGLCRSYWYPVFAFLCRKGLDREQARDCTQDFFTALLEKDYLADIERSKGRFRSFLLAAAGHFLLNWLSAEKAQKRGGGRQIFPLEPEPDGVASWKEPAHSLTPEAVFEYHWAASLLDRTLKRLRAGHPGREFEVMKPFLVGEADRGTLVAAAARLEMSDGAFKVAIHRLRKHYRELLRAEILETLDDAGQVEDEIRYLLRVLAQSGGHAL